MRAKNLFLIYSSIIICLLASNLFCEPEFVVNTHTFGDQIYPAVDMDSEGNFIITWMGEMEGIIGSDIYAQKFDSKGETIGEEFIVNTNADKDQNTPSIVMDYDGNFIIVWSGEESESSNTDIFAKIFDKEGNIVKDEFQVNQYEERSQYEPSVSTDINGNFVIVWTSIDQDGDTRGIFACLLDKSGNFIKEEFQVNDFTEGSQRDPVVSMNNIGDFVVTWRSNNQDGDSYGIFAKKYENTGNESLSEFQVNNYTENSQTLPSVLLNEDGSFIITWSSNRQDGDGYGVYSKLFNTNGEVIRDEFLVNNYIDSYQYNSKIASDNNGNYVITWQSYGQDGSDYGVYAQRFDNSANPVGREFQINTISTDNQISPAITMNNNGNYVITYASENQFSVDSRYDIFARLFKMQNTPPLDIIPPFVTIISPASEDIIYGFNEIIIDASDESGVKSVSVQVSFTSEWYECEVWGDYWKFEIDVTPYQYQPFLIQARAEDNSENIGYSDFVTPFVVNPDDFEEFRVNTTTFGSQNRPDVAINSSGDFVVAWQGDGIYARRYNKDGYPYNDEFQISTGLYGSNPSIALNEDGGFTVVWEEENIIAKQFDKDGNTITLEFIVGDGSDPVIAMNSSGKFVISWYQTQNRSSTIFARIFDSDANPASDVIIVFPDTDSYGQDVAIAEDGSFIITGTVENDNNRNTEVYARRFISDGTPVGDSFQVNTYDDSFQSNPTIDINTTGDFVIAWQSSNQDGFGTGIYAQQFDSSAYKIGDEFRVNTDNLDNQSNPTVAMDADGNFLVIWDNWYNRGEKHHVFAKLFNKNRITNDEFQVDSDILSSGYSPYPAVAMNDEGDYVITWRNLGDIYAKNFKAVEFDTNPPEVVIVSPRDGEWVSGAFLFKIEAYDESSIRNVQIQFNDGIWQTCIESEGFWLTELDTRSYVDGTYVNVVAKAYDNSESANMGFSREQTVLVKHPQVHIYYEGDLKKPGDILDLRTNVMNTRFDGLDLYIVCVNSGIQFWFPFWNDIPQPTRIERGIWDNSIVSIPYAFRPIGTFTFYAAVVDHGTIDMITSDSLKFEIE